MPGPLPKPAATKQRRNRESTKTTLPSEQASESNKVPALPAREKGWHPMVLEWWESVWRSPMASEFLDVDMRSGLFLLADLHQVRWDAKEPRDLIEASKEIRQQEVRFGLSPIDRRRLQWTIEQGESAAERTEARRDKKPGGKKKPKADPRAALKLA
jgi:hypothetical protein